MMNKLLILGSGAVGYVLGAKAGRERYDQIVRLAGLVKDDPRVQATAAHAAEVARDQAPVVKDKVASAAGTAVTAASAAAAKIPTAGSSSTSQSDLEAQLHPDSTARQDNPYPQGDLP